MNVSWQSYKRSEAEKPQSQLLEEWHEKTSFSDDEDIPEELANIFKANQNLDPQANLVKLELEYWQLVRESRKQDLEEEIFHLGQARVSCPSHEVAGWN